MLHIIDKKIFTILCLNFFLNLCDFWSWLLGLNFAHQNCDTTMRVGEAIYRTIWLDNTTIKHVWYPFWTSSRHKIVPRGISNNEDNNCAIKCSLKFREKDSLRELQNFIMYRLGKFDFFLQSCRIVASLYMSRDGRKPAFRASDQVMLKPACSALETS